MVSILTPCGCICDGSCICNICPDCSCKCGCLHCLADGLIAHARSASRKVMAKASLTPRLS